MSVLLSMMLVPLVYLLMGLSLVFLGSYLNERMRKKEEEVYLSRGRNREYHNNDVYARFMILLERLGMGFSRAEFREWVKKECKHKMSKSTLNKQMHRVIAGLPDLYQGGRQGRRKLLPLQTREEIAGWVLTQNDLGNNVILADVVRMVAEQYDVSISEDTASKYLKEFCISRQKVQRKATGFRLSPEEEAKVYWKWLKEMKDKRLFRRGHLAVSFDFTFTGHRGHAAHTWAMQGGQQVKSRAAISSYTNCILTAVWSDGVDRTPPMLFTYNQALNINRVGARYAEKRHRMQQLLNQYGVDSEQIVYMGKPTNESRSYVPESFELVKIFCEHYGPTLENFRDVTTLFSDNGHAFKQGGQSKLGEWFTAHEFYPSVVHQYLSPNDNALHGAAKKQWRAGAPDFKDDMLQSIRLVSLLSNQIRRNGMRWWEHNMLDVENEQACLNRVRGRNHDDNINRFKNMWKERVESHNSGED